MATQSRSKSRSRGSLLAAGAQKRYTDAYRVARTINGLGQAIKVAGLLLAPVMFVSVADSLKSPRAGLTVGLVVGSTFFIIGIIVAAQGQILKAVIDTAVNSSPFLDDGQRAAIMSLSSALRSYGPAEESAAAHELATAEQEVLVSGDEVAAPFCYHCGAQLSDESGVCPTCGKPL